MSLSANSVPCQPSSQKANKPGLLGYTHRVRVRACFLFVNKNMGKHNFWVPGVVGQIIFGAFLLYMLVLGVLGFRRSRIRFGRSSATSGAFAETSERGLLWWTRYYYGFFLFTTALTVTCFTFLQTLFDVDSCRGDSLKIFADSAVRSRHHTLQGLDTFLLFLLGSQAIFLQSPGSFSPRNQIWFGKSPNWAASAYLCISFIDSRSLYFFTALASTALGDSTCSAVSGRANSVDSHAAKSIFWLLCFVRVVIFIPTSMDPRLTSSYSGASFLVRVCKCSLTKQQAAYAISMLGYFTVSVSLVLAFPLHSPRQTFYGIILGLVFHVISCAGIDIFFSMSPQENMPRYREANYEVEKLAAISTAHGLVYLTAIVLCIRLLSPTAAARAVLTPWLVADLANVLLFLYTVVRKTRARSGYIRYASVQP